MKAVINTCYGGFSLSHAALRMLAGLHSPILKKFKISSERSPPLSEFTIDLKDGYFGHKHYSLIYNKKTCLVYELDKPNDFETRSHRDLVQVVEELGKDSWGECAELTVMVNNGPFFCIESYDGQEEIETYRNYWEECEA